MARLDKKKNKKKTKDEGRTNFDDILPRCGLAAVSRFVLFFFSFGPFLKFVILISNNPPPPPPPPRKEKK